jgi:hypothetical protein
MSGGERVGTVDVLSDAGRIASVNIAARVRQSTPVGSSAR